MSKVQSPLAEIDYPAHLEMMWQKHLAPRESDAPTVISTFAGGGGSSLGYSMAGYRELLAVEWDDNAVETFRLNFPDVPVYHGDIAKLSVDRCLELAGVEPGDLDLLDGSPPCQGFSTAGKRILDDPRNQLFKEFVRLLRGLKPKVFVMENVSGMVKGKMKLVFAEILRELRASGYKVSARLLNAMYFHVPQSRQRMIFIGVRDDLGIEPSHPKAESRKIPFKKIDGDYNWLTQEQVKIINDHKRKQKRKGNSFSYCLIKFGEIAPTLSKTFVPIKTGSTSQIFVLDNGKLRYLGINEHKYIGSYPFNFEFSGNYKKQWECIGNSVPPLMAEAIGRHIRQEILSKMYT